jgi:hypothetical protein
VCRWGRGPGAAVAADVEAVADVEGVDVVGDDVGGAVAWVRAPPKLYHK